MLHDVSDDACQIFGGRALTKTGMGKYIEDLQRTYKFNAILGGSEEIMADLGVRQVNLSFYYDHCFIFMLPNFLNLIFYCLNYRLLKSSQLMPDYKKNMN